MDNCVLKLNKTGICLDSGYILEPITFSLALGEHLLINGPAGSGKTVLAKTLAGIYQPTEGTIHRNWDADEMRYISPQPWHDLVPERHYFESRFEVFWGQTEIPTLAEKLIQEKLPFYETLKTFLKEMSLDYILGKQAGQLSNGESKTMQLGMALCNPSYKCVILDKPFLGLDKEKRNKLYDYLLSLSAWKCFVFIEQGFENFPGVQTLTLNINREVIHEVNLAVLREELVNRFKAIETVYEHVVQMKDVSVFYGDSRILHHINWTVKQGEKWLVRGENGSGKSMLMSLITADNPKAYGQDLTLFDLKRGSGESIWDIKSKIGYVSPEAHMYFLKKESRHMQELLQHKESLNDRFASKISCGEVVESGLYDRMDYSGGYISKNTLDFMEGFGVEKLANQRFSSVSLGSQRILLLLRALIKNPTLLIFDEPTQGLDDLQKAIFLKAVEIICEQANSTVLYISHHLDEVPANINKVLSLKNQTAHLTVKEES